MGHQSDVCWSVGHRIDHSQGCFLFIIFLRLRGIYSRDREKYIKHRLSERSGFGYRLIAFRTEFLMSQYS